MHIWALKTQKLPGPLSGPWTPAANCSLRSSDSPSLRRQLSASAPGAPSWPNPGSAPAKSCKWLSSVHHSQSLAITFTRDFCCRPITTLLMEGKSKSKHWPDSCNHKCWIWICLRTVILRTERLDVSRWDKYRCTNVYLKNLFLVDLY